MIHYTLRCDRGHAFESWFQSSSAYESQEKRKLVNCPVCGSVKVERAIMAPRIVSKKGRDSAVPAPAAAADNMDAAQGVTAAARPVADVGASVVGSASPESASAQSPLDAAAGRQQFLANVVAAGDLTLVKSVTPIYPTKANVRKLQGWVELDFTVAENGAVKDIAVHAASAPGVFEDAAISALSQWRYKPVQRDAESVAQRARIRIRFALAD